MAKKKFAEDKAAHNEYIGIFYDLLCDRSKDAERMHDSETKDEKVGENNDVLDVDSLDSFPSLPTTGSQKCADNVEKEKKQKNTCIDTYDDDLAKGTSAVPTVKSGSSPCAALCQRKCWGCI